MSLIGLVISATARADANSVVHVDSRIELMTVVQLLGGYQPLTKIDSAYRRDATNRFERFKTHRAVRLFSEMSQSHFAYDAVPRALLCYSAPPELRPVAPVDKKVLRRAGGQAKLNAFIIALRDFARASDFDGFVKSHANDYAQVEAALRPDVEAAVQALRSYTGLPLRNCELVAGMLIHNGGFQATVQTEPTPTTYAIIGAFGVAQGLPVFTANGSVSYVAQHEFSHSFVNPFVEKNVAAVNRYDGLFKAIKPQMAKLAYADWETVVHEHIVRAIVIRLAHLRAAPAGDRILANEEKQGFRYVRALAERLKDYEAARDKYPTINVFLPELLQAFDAASP